MNGWMDGDWLSDVDELDEISSSMMTVTAPCGAQPLHVAQILVCFGIFTRIISLFPPFFCFAEVLPPSSEDVRLSFSVRTVSLLL